MQAAVEEEAKPQQVEELHLLGVERAEWLLEMVITHLQQTEAQVEADQVEAQV
jgi:hypothetical protein